MKHTKQSKNYIPWAPYRFHERFRATIMMRRVNNMLNLQRLYTILIKMNLLYIEIIFLQA